MIAIRPAQFETFQKAAADAFLDRGVKHVREHLADAGKSLSDDALRERFRNGIERAKRYGLTAEWDVVRFVDASLLLGDPAFDENPKLGWPRQLLTSPLLAPADKADWLLRLAADESPRRR